MQIMITSSRKLLVIGRANDPTFVVDFCAGEYHFCIYRIIRTKCQVGYGIGLCRPQKSSPSLVSERGEQANFDFLQCSHIT